MKSEMRKWFGLQGLPPLPPKPKPEFAAILSLARRLYHDQHVDPLGVRRAGTLITPRDRQSIPDLAAYDYISINFSTGKINLI